MAEPRAEGWRHGRVYASVVTTLTLFHSPAAVLLAGMPARFALLPLLAVAPGYVLVAWLGPDHPKLAAWFFLSLYPLGILATAWLMVLAWRAVRHPRAAVSLGRRFMLWLGILSVSAAALAGAIWLRSHRLEPYRVPSTSMAPTLVEGDQFLVDRRLRPIRRGDIVLFPAPTRRSDVLDKRVIGLPGDRVEVHGHDVLVNGVPLPHSPCPDPAADRQPGRVTCAEEELPGGKRYRLDWSQIPRHDDRSVNLTEGEVFVIGDQRDNSFDSRHFGPIREEEVIGRAAVIYFSPTRSREGYAIGREL